MTPILYIVIPCYNEMAVFPKTAPAFLDKLKELIQRGLIDDQSRVLFVDDGSRDETWKMISSLSARDRYSEGISLSRNRGHQNALLAGLMEAKDRCDITVSVDCDGQDDLDAIDRMIAAYCDGCDVVYGVRKSRKCDSAFKRNSARCFYKILSGMGAEVVYNHADYRLLSKRVLEELAKFKEVNIYLRGMIPLVGFKSTCVYYERHNRIAGKSHYPLKKMIRLAIDGITSLSIKPMHWIAFLGLFFILLACSGIVWALVAYFTGGTLVGWLSVVSLVCFFGGVQLLAIGIIGEYIGKIYMETKQRPRYIIANKTWNHHNDQ